jgi:hypothetical protein
MGLKGCERNRKWPNCSWICYCSFCLDRTKKTFVAKSVDNQILETSRVQKKKVKIDLRAYDSYETGVFTTDIQKMNAI